MRRYNSENDVSRLESAISNDSIIMCDESVKSLPDVSIHNSSRMIELEMQIEQLTQTLQVANMEVDNLILRNSDLQRELENCQIVVKSLRAIQTSGPEKPRCMSPKPVSSKKTPQLFLKRHQEQKNASTQTEDNLIVQKCKTKRNRKIKLCAIPKIKHTNKNLLKQIKKLNRGVRKLQKDLVNLEIEKNRIQHKLIELETQEKLKTATMVQKDQKNIQTKDCGPLNLQVKRSKIKTLDENKDYSVQTKENTNKERVRRIEIFSDKMGSGLASKIMQRASNAKLMNYCQPEASSEQILKHFDQHTKHLTETDLAVILIGYYSENTMKTYVNEIRRIISIENRKFNILIGSVMYDNINNEKILAINRELYNLAVVSENVRYLEVNLKIKVNVKNFIIGEIIKGINDSHFDASSSLHFIKINSEPNSSQNFLDTPKTTLIG